MLHKDGSMQSHVENDLHEDVELQCVLRHGRDVLIDKHETVEMSSQSNVKPVVACVEVDEYRIFKSTLVSQLNNNPTLSKDQLTWIKADILSQIIILC